MTKMAILQDVDKCMRCGGCTIACKREWGMNLPADLDEVTPQFSVVGPAQRVAIKSQKRVDMGPFVRFSCWHCPSAPCAAACPYDAIVEESTGAINVLPGKCNPATCWDEPGYRTGSSAIKPCAKACQRGGYPKIGVAYGTGTYAGQTKMNKCTLCTGKAGAEDAVDANTSLPTRITPDVNGKFISPIGGNEVPELAHEPACVSTCPAKAMIWDSQANIATYLQANYVLPGGTKNWIGNGAMYWGSKNTLLVPPKADPFIEDHVSPMAESLLTGTTGKVVLPTLVVGGLMALSARRARNEAADGGEV